MEGYDKIESIVRSILPNDIDALPMLNDIVHNHISAPFPLLSLVLIHAGSYLTKGGMHAMIVALVREFPHLLSDTVTRRRTDGTKVVHTVLQSMLRCSNIDDDTFAWLLNRVPQEHINLCPVNSPLYRVISVFARHWPCSCYVRVRLLLQRGANIHKDDFKYALVEGNEEVADLLLEHGAPINGVMHPLLDKRNHCEGARKTLLHILLKRKRGVQKDLLRYMIGPMVWATRLRGEWDIRGKRVK